MFTQFDETVYSNSRDYAQALSKWMHKYGRMRIQQQSPYDQWYSRLTNDFYNNLASAEFTPNGAGLRLRNRDTSRQNHSTNQAQNGLITRRAMYSSYSRRIIAECVDMLLSFTCKVLLLYFFVYFNYFDLNKYVAVFEGEATDLQSYIDLAHDLFPIEMYGKILVSVFEAAFLSFGFFAVAPGQTPGKFILGIEVASCIEIQSEEHEVIINVVGSQRLSFFNALFRSFCKNLLINSLFPLSLVAFGFSFNRSLYDVFSKTIVLRKNTTE